MATMDLEVPKRAFRRRYLASSAALLLVNLCEHRRRASATALQSLRRTTPSGKTRSLQYPLANLRPCVKRLGDSGVAGFHFV
jgi:hypothetical protein